jgi:N-acetylneuraminate synthase
MEVFKISSSDITNRPFIEQIADFNKPILLSTGASNKDEIDEALSWIRPGKVTTSLMHCVLNYPTRDEDANLNMITDLKNCYPDNVIGYSDHTLPGDMHILEIATLLGAEILEKHFTHDKKLPGNDHYHAMDKSDLAKLRLRLGRLKLLGGSSSKVCLESEAPARQHARRSLVARTQILAGTTIKDEHLTWKRPASGISPREIKDVIGQVAKVDICEDELLLWAMIQ